MLRALIEVQAYMVAVHMTSAMTSYDRCSDIIRQLLGHHWQIALGHTYILWMNKLNCGKSIVKSYETVSAQ
jgi:hypothetical protein